MCIELGDGMGSLPCLITCGGFGPLYLDVLADFAWSCEHDEVASRCWMFGNMSWLASISGWTTHEHLEDD